MTEKKELVIRSDTERMEAVTVKKRVRTIQFDIDEEFIKTAIRNELKLRMSEAMEATEIGVELDVIPGAIAYRVKSRAFARFVKD